MTLEIDTGSEEFKKRERQFIEHLQSHSYACRKQLLRYVKRRFKLEHLSQLMLRRLSWTHARMLQSDVYEDACKEIHKKLGPTLLIGKTKQDCYHQMHMINAVILAVLEPEAELALNETGTLHQYILVEEDEAQRVEKQAGVYDQLVKMIQRDPDVKQQMKEKITIEQIYELLKEVNENVKILSKTRRR